MLLQPILDNAPILGYNRGTMPPPAEVTLREFMELRFDGLDEKVIDLDGRVKTLEDCINNDVKHAIKMWRYIGGLVVAILAALAAAWLRQMLGL